MKSSVGLLTSLFVVIIAAICGVALILVHNGIVDADNRIEEAEAQIAAVCQRRLDLMPNLIETVKAYAKHEQEVLTAVTMARIQAGKVMEKISQEGLNQENIESLDTSQAQVSTAFRSFFAMVENYPDLKASSNFLTLQDQFEGTENRISVARQRYNTAVRTYNSKLDKFPGIIIAPVFGFEQAGFFQAQPEAFTPIKAAF
jgi:LemA protein